jgi:hypothetical protein
MNLAAAHAELTGESLPHAAAACWRHACRRLWQRKEDFVKDARDARHRQIGFM